MYTCDQRHLSMIYAVVPMMSISENLWSVSTTVKPARHPSWCKENTTGDHDPRIITPRAPVPYMLVSRCDVSRLAYARHVSEW